MYIFQEYYNYIFEMVYMKTVTRVPSTRVNVFRLSRFDVHRRRATVFIYCLKQHTKTTSLRGTLFLRMCNYIQVNTSLFYMYSTLYCSNSLFMLTCTWLNYYNITSGIGFRIKNAPSVFFRTQNSEGGKDSETQVVIFHEIINNVEFRGGRGCTKYHGCIFTLSAVYSVC